jgi:membrane-associated phospholipid phosphatase
LTAVTASPASRLWGRFPHLAATLLAAASAGAAVLAASALDLPLRDPDNAAGPLYVRLPAMIGLLVALDVLPRAGLRLRGGARPASAIRAVILERWSGPRVRLVIIGLVSFYLTYVGYRNLKGFLPFAREGTADMSLLALDRAMGLGSAPSSLLHSVLGTGIAAHVLSLVYVAFLVFVPVSLGVSLVWSRQVRSGYLYVTVLCLNWVLGALSYYLLPSLGPAFVRPELFSGLPATEVSYLQDMLVHDRQAVLGDPHAYGRVQAIAGFASLHVAIVFSAALVAHVLELHRLLLAALWLFLVLTVLATIYFGWHYLVDDVAGLVIGAAAVWLGARVTGHATPMPQRWRWARATDLAPPRPTP